VFGQDFGKDATEGEKLFVKEAGGEAVDRAVRQQVDYDSAQVLRKNRSFSDQILNFGKSSGDPVIDPAAEAERLKAAEVAVTDLTGPGKIQIRRKSAGKLPGL
jgi:hypothetical protein